MRQAAIALSILISAAPGVSGSSPAENWPRFRGPTGLGYTAETDLPVSWGGEKRENVLWESPLAGEGHASPIVWEDRVFITTVRWPASTVDRSKVIPEHHALCYRASDGEMLWDVQVPPGPWLRTDFRSGPGGGYAAPTPASDGKIVACAFGSSVIAALDFDGKIVWRKEIVPPSFDVTLGTSPILFEGNAILLCAMAVPKDSRIVAFDKGTGDVAWETRLPATGFGHSTPVIIDVAGKPQMLVLASGMSAAPAALQSFDPRGGERLWWCRGAGDAASPAYGAGIVYFDSGRGGPGVAVDPTGKGDVTGSHIRWTVPEVPEGIGSPIIVGEHVYRLHSPGILKCWKAATGELVYARRLEGISTTWASPIATSDGKIFFASAGKSYVLQAGPGQEVLAVNDLGDPNHASPAVSGGRMFLAGTKKLHCIGRRGNLPPPEGPR